MQNYNKVISYQILVLKTIPFTPSLLLEVTINGTKQVRSVTTDAYVSRLEDGLYYEYSFEVDISDILKEYFSNQLSDMFDTVFNLQSFSSLLASVSVAAFEFKPNTSGILSKTTGSIQTFYAIPVESNPDDYVLGTSIKLLCNELVEVLAIDGSKYVGVVCNGGTINAIQIKTFANETSVETGVITLTQGVNILRIALDSITALNYVAGDISSADINKIEVRAGNLTAGTFTNYSNVKKFIISDVKKDAMIKFLTKYGTPDVAYFDCTIKEQNIFETYFDYKTKSYKKTRPDKMRHYTLENTANLRVEFDAINDICSSERLRLTNFEGSFEVGPKEGTELNVFDPKNHLNFSITLTRKM